MLLKKRTQTGIRSANILTPKAKSKAKFEPPFTPADAREHSFWNTPAASAQTLRFTDDDLLTDEQFDPGDISVASLVSPLAEVRPRFKQKERPADTIQALSFEPVKTYDAPVSLSFALPEPPEAPPDEAIAGDDDDTIIVHKLLANNPPEEPEPELELELDAPPGESGDSAHPKKSKFRITTEFEDIIVCFSKQFSNCR